MNFNETLDRQVKRLETEINGYLVIVNVELENGKITSLRGNINPIVEEGQPVNGMYFEAHKYNDKWSTDLGRIDNEKFAEVSEIAISAVNYAVAKYEIATGEAL